MSKTILSAIVLVILIASTAFAFDGERKGFVLGGGLGVAPAATWKVDVRIFGYNASVDESRVGIGIHLVIGGAFDEHNMLVYEGNVAAFKSDIFNQNITQGFNGAAWYRYWGEQGNTFFTTLGLGVYYFRDDNDNSTDPGLAVLLGGGYEFAPHWQVGAYISVGQSSTAGINIDHSHINILVSGVAF